MDGLTVSNSDTLLRTGRTVSEMRNDKMNADAVESSDSRVKTFADSLSEAVAKVNELSHTANIQMQKLATGENKNIPEVMIAAEKAGIAFKLLTQVRNKIIDAYQDIMKMQV
ncbi:MAG: flagellar hook-basal body complex protein FliE [Bdellovibrionales bacterium RBG_16_40_8]|nr:MAG: flagellar hook-basal body complex protein FliE [Bdellovibrionales bacterium RBG_16_40_8]